MTGLKTPQAIAPDPKLCAKLCLKIRARMELGALRSTEMLVYRAIAYLISPLFLRRNRPLQGQT